MQAPDATREKEAKDIRKVALRVLKEAELI